MIPVSLAIALVAVLAWDSFRRWLAARVASHDFERTALVDACGRVEAAASEVAASLKDAQNALAILRRRQ